MPLPQFVNPNQTASWQKLKTLAQTYATDIFKQAVSTNLHKIPIKNGKDELVLEVDYSKQGLTEEILEALLEWAREMGVEQWRDAQLAGLSVNVTEGRAAWHTLLRSNMTANDEDKNAILVKKQLDEMREIVDKVQKGKWLGFSNEAVCKIVNVGIGGSDLGPRMVFEALRTDFGNGRSLEAVFLSNVDGGDAEAVLRQTSLGRALFVIASKTFTTAETMRNAHSIKNALIKFIKQGDESFKLGGQDLDALVARHFVAITNNFEEAKKFGVAKVISFEDWVGGRFSVWSPIGLSVACSLGWPVFEQFLAGARLIDEHWRQVKMDSTQNAPLMMALILAWNTCFLGRQTQAICPYEQALYLLPSHLQQLEMESNGKRVDRAGRPLDYPTCPVIWGAPGTNGQHAFFQQLHQGTQIVPVDLIVGRESKFSINQPFGEGWDNVLSREDTRAHHQMLVANCLAQGEALAHGRPSTQQANKFFDEFPGGRPSTLITMHPGLTPFTLGALLALYEHKVACFGYLLNINSFDQFGVELGKKLAQGILSELQSKQTKGIHDPSTLSAIKQAIRDDNVI